ncbi:hypothetical protein EDD63_10823 [Breznakia blatticola]|uniref:Uncharacterized protein n=1 Tax=Breznakia blatticola TaxID=1754012 RepID=A0A4R8A8K6_9FIRM|nr:hypothetical protein [Breznakia blatticola]TDW24670.1 hypothetical protein EDD63_10823 [Breznakia blatticola]
MKKENALVLLGLGCLLICFYPLMGNSIPMLVSGVVIAGYGAFQLFKNRKKDK